MIEVAHGWTGDRRRVFRREPGELEIRDEIRHDTAVVLASTTVDGLRRVIGDALHEVELLTQRAGVAVKGPPFVRYLDWGEGHVVAEIGMPVARPMPAAGRVERGRLPGGRVASIVHLGPYETISETYQRLTAQLEAHDLHTAGPIWEVYWTDPERQADPSTWRTEIISPVG